jgi:hypothetical protein
MADLLCAQIIPEQLALARYVESRWHPDDPIDPSGQFLK